MLSPVRDLRYRINFKDYMKKALVLICYYNSIFNISSVTTVPYNARQETEITVKLPDTLRVTLGAKKIARVLCKTVILDTIRYRQMEDNISYETDKNS